MSQSQNKLTVYSNGVTRIQRYVSVEGRTTVTIPVRKAYVSDVLATLGVYGKVKLVEPPSYNNDATKNALKLDPKNVYFDLATKLSGADVKVYSTGSMTEGRLAGVHSVETISKDGVTKTVHFVVLANDGTVRTFNQSVVGSIEFQPEVQRLIQNALAKNFESVRPDSVLLKLVLEPVVSGGKVEALLDYATPTAAWQSIYQLRVGETTTLEYNAKLDNPTDEDWLQTKVSVVVGEPITFDTDLGEVRTPTRAKVNIVSSQATGPVRAQEAMRLAKSARVMSLQSLGGSGMRGGGLEACAAGAAPEMDEDVGGVNYCQTASFESAQVSQATGEEIGDFAVFTSEDVIDVRGNLSGVVRLFTEKVEAKEILFFDYGQDRERAYRGLRVTNTTKNTLGKGVVTAYLHDTFAGQAVMETCKPGKSKTLVFSRENSVEVTCKPKGAKPSRIAIGMANGELWWQDRVQYETTYNFENLSKDTAFDVEVNHTFTQSEPTFDVASGSDVKSEQTKTGLKLTFKLDGDGVVGVTVFETKVNRSAWTLEGINGLARLHQFFSSGVGGAKFKKADGYKAIETMLAEYNAIATNVQNLEDEAESLKEEQERLLKLVTAGTSASQLSKWQGNLDKTEDRITEIEKKLVPDGRDKAAHKDEEITAALKAFAFSWADGEETKVSAKSKR